MLTRVLGSVFGVGCLLAGCSSTLDEYRCTSNEQCSADESTGLCHSSGYCTFLDEQGCDGYRFGKHSGDLSNQCVDDADLPDGGVDDGTRPIARIEDVNLPCDQTTVSVDGTGSRAFDGAELMNFEWSLLAPNGDNIGSIEGGPDNNFRRGPNFVNGTLAEPIVNLTPYMDTQALRVDTGGDLTVAFQDGLSLKEGDRVLFFSVGAEGGADGNLAEITITLKGSDTTQDTIVDRRETLTTSMTTHQLEFEADDDLSDVELAFEASEGSFWLDNVGIENRGSGGSTAPPIVENRSFEQGMAPWSNRLGPDSAVSVAPLPPTLQRPGEYTIRLVVTDSNGVASLPDEIELEHQSCLDGT